jgi:hypothetical protein
LLKKKKKSKANRRGAEKNERNAEQTCHGELSVSCRRVFLCGLCVSAGPVVFQQPANARAANPRDKTTDWLQDN